jgi:hypothetical protein
MSLPDSVKFHLNFVGKNNPSRLQALLEENTIGRNSHHQSSESSLLENKERTEAGETSEKDKTTAETSEKDKSGANSSADVKLAESETNAKSTASETKTDSTKTDSTKTDSTKTDSTKTDSASTLSTLDKVISWRRKKMSSERRELERKVARKRMDWVYEKFRNTQEESQMWKQIGERGYT